MITEMYDGKIQLDFNEARHRFTIDGKPIISVTGATGVIDKSRPLIIWATRLSTAYLMENLKELIDDKKGGRIVKLIEEAEKQHYKVKKAAGDVGTQVHDWAEKFIKAKTKADWPSIPEETLEIGRAHV